LTSRAPLAYKPAVVIFAPDLLRDRVAIVTGGGTGIGKAIARELGRVGADLVIASRKPEHVEPTAVELAAETGRRVLALRCDIREPDQVAALVERALAEYGRIDVLVNNAGGQFPIFAEHLRPKGWRAVIDTNLSGTWYVTQTVGRTMIERRRGVIINITAAFWRGMPGIAHSSAARAAVTNLAKSLAVEWAPHGIRVNNVAAGPIATGAFEATYDPGIGRVLQRMPLRRFGRPEEIAWAVVYLASPAAEWITGASLCIDGGMHFWGEPSALPE
jgi:NAD(P)-dependent dehydrogenase (short-subunit alcohol dehydrogenase family)